MKHHYSVGYFISQAFKGLWRNRLISATSMAVLACCLVVMGAFAILYANINSNLQDLKLADEIAVYLEYDATEEDARRVESKLKDLGELGIGEVKFISKEEALESMREQYKDYEALFDSITAEENPLSYSFEITVEDVSRGVELEFALESLDDSIRKVNNRIDMAQQFETAKTNIGYAFVVFLALLIIVCAFVILNTVSLAVYARRNEIIVMRYVGATRWFVATPFVLEGVIMGLVSSVIAFFAEGALYRFIISKVSGDFGIIRLIPYSEVDMMILWGFIAVGIGTGVIGSLLSLRRDVEA